MLFRGNKHGSWVAGTEAEGTSGEMETKFEALVKQLCWNKGKTQTARWGWESGQGPGFVVFSLFFNCRDTNLFI